MTVSSKLITGLFIILFVIIPASILNASENQTTFNKKLEWKDSSANSIVQTANGDYAVTGSSGGDLLLFKTDENGNVEWKHTYGGQYLDEGKTVIKTIDGGYAVVGYTVSYGQGKSDVYLIKTDSLGTLEWNMTYGGLEEDSANSIVQAKDGGYVISGQTFSYGAGEKDVWLIKTDDNGIIQWSKTYGGADTDYGCSVVEPQDGDFVVAGTTLSFGTEKSDDTQKTDDYWMIKTDANGNMKWNKTYGGVYFDYANSMIQTNDGGYAIVGFMHSYENRFDYKQEFYLVKTDANGNTMWTQSYEGQKRDKAYSVTQTVDGGYAIVGITEPPEGNDHLWLVKTNSVGAMQWNQTFGAENHDGGYCVIQTKDEGYAVAGYYSYESGDSAWLIKTDSTGKIASNNPTLTPTQINSTATTMPLTPTFKDTQGENNTTIIAVAALIIIGASISLFYLLIKKRKQKVVNTP
jgi:hypothetical protein